MKAFLMFDEWAMVEVLRTYRAHDGTAEADFRYLDGPAKGVESSCALSVLMSDWAARGLVRRLDASPAEDRPEGSDS